MSYIQRSLFRVRYAETDAMGVAHHANYPIWFEMGRSDLMRTLGYPYAQLEAEGFFLMLSELNVQYRRAARYDQELCLETRLLEVKSRGVTFGYRLLHQAQGTQPQTTGAQTTEAQATGSEVTLLASGHSRHISTNKAYAPSRLPNALLEGLRLALGTGTTRADTDQAGLIRIPIESGRCRFNPSGGE